jgi:hypothetical protein
MTRRAVAPVRDILNALAAAIAADRELREAVVSEFWPEVRDDWLERIERQGIHGPRGARDIRVLLGPVRDLTQGEIMATTPFKLRTQQGVVLTLAFPDAAGVDEAADVDPAAVVIVIDRADLLALGTDPQGARELQSRALTGTALVTITATDRQGTVLPPVTQEIDILERVTEPIQIVPTLGAVRDLP